MKNIQEIINRIVDFYTSYDYSADLVRRVQVWLGDDMHREQKDSAMESAWEKTVEQREQPYSRREVESALKNVRRKIGAGQKRETRKIIGLGYRLRRIAAILVPIFLIAGIGLLLIDGADDTTKISSTISVSVPGGSERLVNLPDGSRVWLNGNSRLAYDGENFTIERKVELEGEAFFEVTGDREHPFRVETEHLSVEVLGTKFNVHSSSDAAQTKVALASGMVQVALSADRSEKISLEEGTELTYDKSSGETTLGEIAECWWEGPLEFKMMTIQEIFVKLEQCYGIDINTTALGGIQDKFSFEFDRSESVEDVIGLIARFTLAFTYDIRGETVTVRPVLAP